MQNVLFNMLIENIEMPRLRVYFQSMKEWRDFGNLSNRITPLSTVTIRSRFHYSKV